MLNWPAKTPGAVLDYTWDAPVDAGDALATYTVEVTGATIASDDSDGNAVTVFVSGGTAGQTAVFTFTGESNEGRYLEETIYLPIIASPAQIADTARDYCNFALRKVVGNGNSADSAEMDDALERLSGIIAKWREGGADIGAPFPLTASSVIYCPDYAAEALRFNLRISCHDHYDAAITPFDVEQARRGLQLVKHKNLRDDRAATYN